MRASLAIEMTNDFETMIFLQYHSATPMLLAGERIAVRMLSWLPNSQRI